MATNKLLYLYVYDYEVKRGAGTHRVDGHPKVEDWAKQLSINQKDQMRNMDKRSVPKDPHTFHCMRTPQAMIVCVSDPSAKLRIVFGMLEHVEDTIIDGLDIGGDLKGARKTLRDELTEFDDPHSDIVSQCKVELDQIKELVTDNLDKVFARGEALEVVAMKAEELEEGAMDFGRTAAELKRMTQRRCIATIIAIVMVVVCLVICIIFIIVLAVCAGAKACGGGGGS